MSLQLRIAARLLFWLALLCLPIEQKAFGVSSREANELISAYNSTFYTVSGTNGYFKDRQTGGVAYFWGQAEMIECVIDAYEWTSNSVYHAMITNLLNGFLRENGSSWLGNMYNDDIMWAVIAFARGGRLTGHPNFCNIAKANFDPCFARAWDSKLGGGLYWTTDNNTKNACVNGPASIAASLLYEIYGDPGYLSKATSAYFWERSVLFNTNTGAIYDAIRTNGVINTWASTYNQGTFIGAANFLNQTNDARLAAQYTMTRLTSSGILPEYGIAGNNSGFNAIFLRWMTRFMKQRKLEATYMPWVQRNSTAAWNVRRSSDNLSWCEWGKPTPNGTNFYAWDCISSFEVLHAAEPTHASSNLPVPGDFVGYWPFDSINTAGMLDASGRGNTGIVNGARLSPNGRVNSCLEFNGTNSSVQVTNPISTDFTIAFWVKSVQAGGSGHWYNGKGLVDGDVPLFYNDFGTALIAGRFAFGLGNPDATIVSAVSINNGGWHHCVVTRQRATGVNSIYVDGRLQTTGLSHKNTLNAPTSLTFGALSSGGGHFQGFLDEIKLFARALTSNEVAALFFSTEESPMAVPGNLAAVPGNGQVELRWAEAPLATSYKVKRSITTGGPFTTVASVTSTGYRDSNLLNNRSYYYVVTAVNGAGESGDSVEISATPSSLVAWFKATSFGGLTNGAPISLWRDTTGRGSDAVQTLTANQPVVVADAINGLPAVRFTAANSTSLWFYRPVQEDFTITILYKSSQGIGTGTHFYEGAGLLSGEVSGLVNDFGIALNANGQILAGTGNPDTTIRSGIGYHDGKPHVLTFKRTRSTGVIVLYMDGSPVASAAAGTQSLNSPNLFVLGAHQVFNSFFTGDIAEVLVFNSALSEADRAGYERSLRCKYGLAGGGTPGAVNSLVASAGNRKASLNWAMVPGASAYQVWRSTNNGSSFQLLAGELGNSSYEDKTVLRGQTNIYRVFAMNNCGAGPGSANASVFLPLPTLSAAGVAGTLTLSWPTWADDLTLFSATNLAVPVFWTNVTNVPATNNGQLTISVPVSSGTQFFRLAIP